MELLSEWWILLLALPFVLLAPALWNGFPLIFPDTGGYLERPLLGTLEIRPFASRRLLRLTVYEENGLVGLTISAS